MNGQNNLQENKGYSWISYLCCLTFEIYTKSVLFTTKDRSPGKTEIINYLPWRLNFK